MIRGSMNRLPYSIRILLESAIRNCDGFQVMVKDAEKIFDLENTMPKQVEIPFKPAKVLLQAEALDLEKTVLQTVEESAKDWRIDDVKGLLGRCNFKADILDRKVLLLSGGEKAYEDVMLLNFLSEARRLLLCCLLFRGPIFSISQKSTFFPKWN